MARRAPTPPAAAFLALAIVLAFAPGARASTEEFSTFDVIGQEQDDESFIDHALMRYPAEWRDEWERAPNAVRMSQGCLNSVLWMMDTDLKAQSALGRRARFELLLDQSETDRASWNNLELWFRFPQRVGTLGVLFRPYNDKTRQDMALSWGLGTDSSSFQMEATYGFEDLFNNLWAFRAAQTGGRAEPYVRHPWEPALRVAVRRAGWRLETAGKWRTPSAKRLQPFGPGRPPRTATLSGARGHAALEFLAGGVTWELRGDNWQSTTTDHEDGAGGDQRHFRRWWSAEIGARAQPRPRLTAEARWSYHERTADLGPPWGPARFQGVDRVIQAEARWAARPALTLRVGGLFDRVTVVSRGPLPWLTDGTRNESRPYIGLAARFQRVRFSAVEGVELDPEPYKVNFHHDKAFVQLQTTF